MLAFLFSFSILLVLVLTYYLVPALDAVRDAQPDERLRLVAMSRLLLAILLVILITGLILTFRVGRFFFPRKSGSRTRTKYPDAWAESARRVEVPPREDEEDEDDDHPG